MSRYKRSGWFKESHRHSLAAQGISTAKYYTRKGVAILRAELQRLERDSLSVSSPEQKAEYEEQIRTMNARIAAEELNKGPSQTPERQDMPTDPEEFLKRVVMFDQPSEVKAQYFNSLSEMKRINERLDELEEQPSVSRLQDELNAYRGRRVNETDPELIEFYDNKIEELKYSLDAARESNAMNQEELSQLREKKSELLGFMAKTEGRPVQQIAPLTLTEEQVHKKYRRQFGEEEGEKRFAEYHRAREAFRRRLEDVSNSVENQRAEAMQQLSDIRGRQAEAQKNVSLFESTYAKEKLDQMPEYRQAVNTKQAVDSNARAKASELNNLVVGRALSNDKVLQELTVKLNDLTEPVALKYTPKLVLGGPPELISGVHVLSDRVKYLPRLEEFQRSIVLRGPKPKEMSTAPAPQAAGQFIKGQTPKGVSVVVVPKRRELATETGQRIAERREEMKDRLREGRLAARPGKQLLRDEAQAVKEDEKMKGEYDEDVKG